MAPVLKKVKDESSDVARTIIKRPRPQSITTLPKPGYSIGALFAETCEKLRTFIMERDLNYFYLRNPSRPYDNNDDADIENGLPDYSAELTLAINKCDWKNPECLGKAIQEVYLGKNPKAQIIILNNQGHPLYFENDHSKNYNCKLFFAFDSVSESLIGVINLNQFFKTHHYCTNCLRKYGNKTRDVCLK